MAYVNTTITEQGLALIDKVILGSGQLVFTSMAIGDGENLNEPSTATDLVNKRIDVEISKVYTTEDGSVVCGNVENSTVEESFEVREVGVFASQEGSEDTPILFAYIECEGVGDIPAADIIAINNEMLITIATGNANVLYIDNPTAAVTRQDISELTLNLENKQDKLSTEQTNAINSGVTSSVVSQVTTNKNNIDKKQDTLVSGTSIKTINGESILGSGNITINADVDLDSKQDTLVSGTNIKTINGESLLGEGDITIESGGLSNLATETNSLSILGEATTSLLSTSVGYKANASGGSSIALGYNAKASNGYAIALGRDAKASSGYAIALGYEANAMAQTATAIGYKATTTETGTTVLSAWNNNGSVKTQFKIIGAGSTASTKKLGGLSGIEYEEYDSSGNIVNSGAISFSSLFSGGGGVSGDYLPLSGGTVTDNFSVLPLGTTTALGAPAYGLHVSSTGGLQLFGTHFLNGTLWGDDGLKIVSNNLSLNTLDEAFISSDYANTTTFRAMPNDGTQATYKFEGWGWDDDSHTTKSARLGVRLLKPSQATELEATSVLNMEEGDARWGGGSGSLQNNAKGTNSLSILGAATTSNGSTSVGVSANASGTASVAIGYSTNARSDSDTAVGYQANASGGASTALGRITRANGYRSTAVGYYTEANGRYSTALGNDTKANADYSTAIGIGVTATESGVTAISAWNDDGTAKTQFKIIGAGSTASTNKFGGKSGIEYEEYDTSGTLTTSKAIPFDALFGHGINPDGATSYDVTTAYDETTGYTYTSEVTATENGYLSCQAQQQYESESFNKVILSCAIGDAVIHKDCACGYGDMASILIPVATGQVVTVQTTSSEPATMEVKFMPLN